VRVRAPVFDEAILHVTLDLDDVRRARADSPLLNDLRVALPHLLESLERVRREEPARLDFDAARDDGRGASHELVRADERGAGAADGMGTPDVGSPGAATSPTIPDPVADAPADAAGDAPDRGERGERDAGGPPR
jgi:hypothetical protein